MVRRATWALTPQQSVAAECARRGREQVVAGCVALLAGDTSDTQLIRDLGGPPADALLSGRSAAGEYWYAVWAMRGLLWSYLDTPAARAAVVAALGHEAWRVREMGGKVVARHLVAEAFPAVVVLRDDPVARVRTAAERALAVLSAAGC